MKNAAFVVVIGLAVLAAGACQQTPTGPKLGSIAPAEATPGTDTTDTAVTESVLMGTWQATKAEVWHWVATPGGGFEEVAGTRRDLVAEGGTVTLVLQPTDQVVGRATPGGAYTITVAMPGAAQGVDTGFFSAGPAWQKEYQGLNQIDFYPARLLPDIEYGEVMGFLWTLTGDSLRLWDSGQDFLPYDFGWRAFETGNVFEFVRR